MTNEFLSFRLIQTGNALSKQTSEPRNWLKIKACCHCLMTASPAASHHIHGSVKLIFWNKRGWEKWSSTPSVGISALILLHVDMALTPRKQPTSFYSSAFTFFKLLRAKSVRALRIFLHVLFLFPVSFYYFFNVLFLHRNSVLCWRWTSRVTWIHSCGKLERALCTVSNTS